MVLDKKGLGQIAKQQVGEADGGLAAAGSCGPGRAPHRGRVGCLNGPDVSSGQRREAPALLKV